MLYEVITEQVRDHTLSSHLTGRNSSEAGEAPETAQEASGAGGRITSYNVCYTKLLRSRMGRERRMWAARNRGPNHMLMAVASPQPAAPSSGAPQLSYNFV